MYDPEVDFEPDYEDYQVDETKLSDSVELGKKDKKVKKKVHPCPLCKFRPAMPKKHVIRYHFPKELSRPKVSKEQVCKLYKAMLDYVIDELHMAEVGELFVFAEHYGLLTKQHHVIDKTVQKVSSTLNIKNVTVEKVRELLHWRTMASILAVLEPEKRSEVRFLSVA